MGLRWAVENRPLLDANGLTYQGESIGLPRYYLRKLDLSSARFYEDLADSLDVRDKAYLDSGVSVLDLSNLVARAGIQRGINASAKDALFSRD